MLKQQSNINVPLNLKMWETIRNTFSFGLIKRYMNCKECVRLEQNLYKLQIIPLILFQWAGNGEIGLND